MAKTPPETRELKTGKTRGDKGACLVVRSEEEDWWLKPLDVIQNSTQRLVVLLQTSDSEWLERLKPNCDWCESVLAQFVPFYVSLPVQSCFLYRFYPWFLDVFRGSLWCVHFSYSHVWTMFTGTRHRSSKRSILEAQTLRQVHNVTQLARVETCESYKNPSLSEKWQLYRLAWVEQLTIIIGILKSPN